MTDQDEEDRNSETEANDAEVGPKTDGPSRRTVLQTAAGLTAVGALNAGSAHAYSYDGLRDALVTPLERDRIPPSQGARNWITNVAYWYEFPSNNPEDLEVWG